MTTRTFEDLIVEEMQIATFEGWRDEQDEQDDGLYEFETAAENAWLVYSERFDPEAQHDLELHNMMHPNGYGH